MVCGSTSITGCPSPAGTLISSINGNKLPVPVIAVGILALSLTANGRPMLTDEKLGVSEQAGCGARILGATQF